jgi:predicted transcriptional regulator
MSKYATVKISREADERLSELARKEHRTKMGQVAALIELAERIDRERGEQDADAKPKRRTVSR